MEFRSGDVDRGRYGYRLPVDMSRGSAVLNKDIIDAQMTSS